MRNRIKGIKICTAEAPTGKLFFNKASEAQKIKEPYAVLFGKKVKVSVKEALTLVKSCNIVLL